MTYANLSGLLLDVQEIVQDAASDTPRVQVDWVRVASAPQAASPTTVARESETLTLSGNYAHTAFTEAPREAKSVIYQFHATNHPITNVIIRLEHSRRNVTVAGTSRFQVQRLSDAIQSA